MAGLPPRTPGDPIRISGAYLTLIVISFSELRRDMIDLIDSEWEEPLRRRAHELASTLAEACDRQGLQDVAGCARSLANLARLTREKAVPLQSALHEKAGSLLREAEKQLSRHSKRRLG
jgi:hypothetical protein